MTEHDMSACPCDLKKDFSKCCGPIIEGKKKAKTPVELMRARYSAYTIQEMDFIEATHDPKTIEDFDMDASAEWAKNTKWLSLEILDADEVGPQDTVGDVEFFAEYEDKKGPGEHHEISTFKKRNGNWYFSDSAEPGEETFYREEPKVGRNDPCHCGSGKKYKKCCLALDEEE